MAQKQPRAKTPPTSLAAETPSSTTSTAGSSTTATLDRSGKKNHNAWRVVASVRALSPGLAYAPASGVGHYRQAAPLGADVKKVVMEVEEKEERGELVDQDILTAENVALDGAERSLLTKVRSQMVLSKG